MDHRKMRTFQDADALLFEVYELTAGLPGEERYGLQAQIRRAAVGCAVNQVEGAKRDSPRDFARFLTMARSSGAEVAYLLSVVRRLGFVDQQACKALESRYRGLQIGLGHFIARLR